MSRMTCLWTTSWRQFKSDCHQTSSVIPLATGDKVIKFWKVKVGGGGMRSTERRYSCCCLQPVVWLVLLIRSLCGTRVRVEHATGKVRPKPWLRRGGGGGGGPVRAPSPRPVRRSYDNDRERCAYCGERGHPSYDCPRERRGRRRLVLQHCWWWWWAWMTVQKWLLCAGTRQ